ncbi:conserved Plasmodium protein, unknown function [Plasmodium reichenowi]|uniref:Uncharacterized protein n=1 Tax=Plasmodium reichenowi TaxID=5854 RepID=A0A060RXX2_PLARE|nr:conserved Plasmodium protein, unknown function [Plasmodium reichenowi]
MRRKDKTNTCFYCLNIIKERCTYINNLWRTYKMCISCKNNLKSCICCEKKIMNNKNISSLTSCCGSSREKLCEECCSIPLICCNKNVVNIIGDILCFLDLYLHINISEEFITFQNIYTFNKIQYNEKNHIYTFQLNHMKYNKIERSTYITLNHREKNNRKEEKKMGNMKYNINNKRKKKRTNFFLMHKNEESQIKDNVTISPKIKTKIKIKNVKKVHKVEQTNQTNQTNHINHIKHINKSDKININNITTNNNQRKYFSSFFKSFKSLYTKKRNNIYISNTDKNILIPSINIIEAEKNEIIQSDNINNVNNIQETFLINNNIKTNTEIREKTNKEIMNKTNKEIMNKTNKEISEKTNKEIREETNKEIMNKTNKEIMNKTNISKQTNISSNNNQTYDTFNNNIPIHNTSRISRFYTNTSAAFFDYIKKIRKQQQKYKKNIKRNKKDKNNKKIETKKKKRKFIFYENILLSIYEKKKEQKIKDNEKNNLPNKRNMDKYKLNLVLYFMDKQDFNGVYRRLLHNELIYCDIIYLNYILKKKCLNKYGNDKCNDYIYNNDIYSSDAYNNDIYSNNTHSSNTHSNNTHSNNTHSNNTHSNNTHSSNTHSSNIYNNYIYNYNTYDDNICEKMVSSCGCVTVSGKKLFKLHEQNKRIHNYKYKNINLKYLSISNENIKLIDNVSLTSVIPKISFYFYLAHELMHGYIWLTKMERSHNYKHIYMIVEKLYNNNYFEVQNEMHYNDYHNNNSSFYISRELEEALCIYVSIKFLKYIETDPYYNIQKSFYEKELIQYYIKKYEQSTSPMYGSNYRFLKKILKNYQIIHVLHIINDIYFSKFYPIVTLNLLQAVISFIDFKI